MSEEPVVGRSFRSASHQAFTSWYPYGWSLQYMCYLHYFGVFCYEMWWDVACMVALQTSHSYAMTDITQDGILFDIHYL